jgi:hypothetical protein
MAKNVPHDRPARRTWLVDLTFVVVTVGLLTAYVAPTLDEPLLEGYHVFRQTQTAYTARIFSEEGIDLLHPEVPVFGEPFELPFEFPLFQAGAALLMEVGVDETVALRLGCFLCFVATALLLYGMLRHVAGRVVALCAFAAFSFFPFSLVWSRTSMMEYLATAGAIGWTWGLIAWRERRRPLSGALALTAGLVGMLVKPTTAVFWVIPALVYRLTDTRAQQTPRWRTGLETAAIVVVPIVAALAWTRHADAVKAATQTTEWLTSRELSDWNFGTIDQRFERDTWETIIDRLRGTVLLSLWVFVPVAVIAGARSRDRRFWLGVAATVLLPLLLFTNLYYVHEYYLAAITPGLAALVGLGAAHVWSVLPRHRGVHAAAGVFAVSLVVVSLLRSDHYWYRTETTIREPQNRPLARELEAATSPDDLVAVVGLDWSPAVLYHARRRGHMVVDANESFAYDLIHDTGYRHVLVADPSTTNLVFLSRWRWIGALGPHTFAVADDAGELPATRFVGSDEPPAQRYLDRGRILDPNGFRLACGRRSSVPAGDRGTWIELRDPPERARIAVLDDVLALPARAHVFVDAGLASGGSIPLTCEGTSSLVVLRVVAGRPPR